MPTRSQDAQVTASTEEPNTRERSVQVERDTDNELLAAMQEEARSYTWKGPAMMELPVNHFLLSPEEGASLAGETDAQRKLALLKDVSGEFSGTVDTRGRWGGTWSSDSLPLAVGSNFKVHMPEGLEDVAMEFYAIPVPALPTLVDKYVDYIMTGRTDETCACEWITHPDDVDLPFGKRRIKRGAEDPECMVHTKKGYLLGFFARLFADES